MLHDQTFQKNKEVKLQTDREGERESRYIAGRKRAVALQGETKRAVALQGDREQLTCRESS